MAKKIVTLFIRDTGIQLLEMNGHQIKRWASLPLTPGLVNQGVITDEVQVASAIRELFKLGKVRATKVIAGLGGLNSLYRLLVLPDLPEPLLSQAVKREATKAMPISLDEFYLSYQPVPSTKGEKRVFVTAYPRSIPDATYRTLRRAGLQPYLMDLAPLALARIPDEPRAVIINVESEHFDIVVTEERLPQIIRRLSLPSEAKSLSEKLPVVTEELNRTVTFYNSNHLDKPLDSTVPAFVCGELAQAPETWQSLVGKLNFPVSLLPTPVEFPEAFPPNEFMVNIGLALKEPSVEGARANSSIINLNALPAAYLPKYLPVTKILVVAAAIVGIGILTYMGLSLRDISSDIGASNARYKLLTEQYKQQRNDISALTPQIPQGQTQIKSIQAQIDQAMATKGVIDSKLVGLAGNNTKTDKDCGIIVNLMLPGADSNLTEVYHSSDSIIVKGILPDESSIFAYARALRSNGGFPTVIISSITAEENEAQSTTLFRFEFHLQ